MTKLKIFDEMDKFLQTYTQPTETDSKFQKLNKIKITVILN